MFGYALKLPDSTRKSNGTKSEYAPCLRIHSNINGPWDAERYHVLETSVLSAQVLETAERVQARRVSSSGHPQNSKYSLKQDGYLTRVLDFALAWQGVPLDLTKSVYEQTLTPDAVTKIPYCPVVLVPERFEV